MNEDVFAVLLRIAEALEALAPAIEPEPKYEPEPDFDLEEAVASLEARVNKQEVSLETLQKLGETLIARGQTDGLRAALKATGSDSLSTLPTDERQEMRDTLESLLA